MCLWLAAHFGSFWGFLSFNGSLILNPQGLIKILAWNIKKSEQDEKGQFWQSNTLSRKINPFSFHVLETLRFFNLCPPWLRDRDGELAETDLWSSDGDILLTNEHIVQNCARLHSYNTPTLLSKWEERMREGESKTESKRKSENEREREWVSENEQKREWEGQREREWCS